ncbi:MAG: ankyrin repeat domain-containing protein, partial [Desulfocapsa sp.]|nr:ankyrin repeat domain-containing protein [Desulfocapsa sp.]
MKIVPIIMLMLFLPTLSSAASKKCAGNYNKSVRLYMDGASFYSEGEDHYEKFKKNKTDVNSEILSNFFDKKQDHQKTRQDIINLVRHLNTAIEKTQKGNKTTKRGMNYGDKAIDYCYEDDSSDSDDAYSDAVKNYEIAERYLKQGTQRLQKETRADAADSYVAEKKSLLTFLIRMDETDAAIYLIENEDIDLDFVGEYEEPLITIAAERTAMVVAKALIDAGADIDQQNDNGYTALQIAGIIGDYELFTYLFNHKASPFLLDGFKRIAEYKDYNIANMIMLAREDKRIWQGLNLRQSDLKNGHGEIAAFLKNKGLMPINRAVKVVATVNGLKILQTDIDFVFKTIALPKFQSQNQGQDIPADQKSQHEKEIL